MAGKGTQDAVLRAVSRGYRNAKDIAEASDISQDRVYTYLRRLMDQRIIECTKKTGCPKEYHLMTIEPMIWDIWGPSNTGTGAR